MEEQETKSNSGRVPGYIKQNGVYVPSCANALIDAVGFVAAMELLLAFGGGRVRVPVNPAGGKIEEVVGADAARKISELLAEEVLEVPLANDILALYLLHDCGWSVPKIANRLRIARRRVNYLRAGEKQDWPQGKDDDEAA